jgi:hypothetical protein
MNTDYSVNVLNKSIQEEFVQDFKDIVSEINNRVFGIFTDTQPNFPAYKERIESLNLKNIVNLKTAENLEEMTIRIMKKSFVQDFRRLIGGEFYQKSYSTSFLCDLYQLHLEGQCDREELLKRIDESVISNKQAAKDFVAPPQAKVEQEIEEVEQTRVEIKEVEERDIVEIKEVEERDIVEIKEVEGRDIVEIKEVEERDIVEIKEVEERDIVETKDLSLKNKDLENKAITKESLVQDFRQLIGGEFYQKSFATNHLCDLYQVHLEGQFDREYLHQEIESSAITDKQAAKDFVTFHQAK